jgi:predicted phosphodiesterase
MTLLAVLADIHGNLPALEAIITDMAQFQVDHVIVAGDLINVGPSSAEVVERVVLSGWSAIRGNHEFYMLDHGTTREPESRRHFTMPPWLHRTIPVRWQHYIAAMPDSLMLFYPDALPVCVAHGVPGDPWRGIHHLTPASQASEMLKGLPTTTLIVGHTHLPFSRFVEVEGRPVHILNPGSAGLPLDGNPGMAHYALLRSHSSGWDVEFRRAAFDVQAVLNEFDRINYVQETGHTGLLLAEEIKTARLRIVPFILWQREHHPNQPESLALARRYLETGLFWEYTPEQFWVNVPDEVRAQKMPYKVIERT